MRDLFFLFGIFLFVNLIILSSCKKQSNNKIDETHDIPVIYWTPNKDVIIENDYELNGEKLIIEPGTNIYFKEGCSIIVSYEVGTSISAIGTKEKPINFLPFPDGNNIDKYWGGVVMKGGASIFSHCNFIKGGEGVEAVISTDYMFSSNISLTITDCYFDYSLSGGISVKSLKEFSGNTIKHTEGQPITLSLKDVGNLKSNNTIIPSYPKQGILLTPYSSEDTIIWRAQPVPYIITGSFSISKGIHFVAPGTIIAFMKGASLSMSDDVCFSAIGEIENPIVFTSAEKYPKQGDWRMISVWKSKAKFDNCIFEYGGGDSYSEGKMISVYGQTTSFKNCTFQHSEGTSIFLDSDNLSKFEKFTNNKFIDISDYAISMLVQATSSIGDSNIFNGYRVLIREGDIESHVLWKRINTDYSVGGWINVNDASLGAKLEIEPGVHVYWSSGGLQVNRGVLIAAGTLDNPIIFTSSKEDPYYGDWSGIIFYQYNLQGSIIKNVNILYAGRVYSSGTLHAAMEFHASEHSVTIQDCIISYSESCGIRTYGNVVLLMNNNEFIDNLIGGLCY